MDELDGVPEMIINSFEKLRTSIRLHLQYPEYGPFMRYAKNRKKRGALCFSNNTGGTKNRYIKTAWHRSYPEGDPL